MSKRLFSFLLAVLMLAGICIPAYAEGTEPTEVPDGVSEQDPKSEEEIPGDDLADSEMDSEERDEEPAPDMDGAPNMSDGPSMGPANDVEPTGEPTPEADPTTAPSTEPTTEPTTEPSPEAEPAPDDTAAMLAVDGDDGIELAMADDLARIAEVPGVWKTDGSGNRYCYRDGQLLLGWYVEGDAKYFLKKSDGSGKAMTGWVKVKHDGVTRKYYFDDDGKMLTGIQKIDGQRYYFKEGDLDDIETGSMQKGWAVVDGAKYFLKKSDGSGKAMTGWVKVKSGGVTRKYYFGSDGKMLTGIQKIDGQRYYLKEGDLNDIETGSVQKGWAVVDGAKYFLKKSDGSGRAMTGWVKVKSGGVTRKYYFGSDGKMLTGVQKINGQNYCLKEGDLNDIETGSLQLGWAVSGGAKYFLKKSDGSGKVMTGWVKIKSGGVSRKYYFGSDGKMFTGWQTVGGKKYYFVEGDLNSYLTGAVATGWQTINGAKYYFDSNGAMANGLYDIGGQWYYFSNGAAQANKEIKLGIKTYTTDANGMISGFKGSKQAVSVLNDVGWDLKAAYNWAAGLRYANRWYRNSSVDGYANYGFSNRYGNCYVMNSCLFKMAQALGYDAKFMSGAVRGSRGDAPHGWCEIKIGDTWYVFDSNFHNETGRNGYQIQYGQSGTWQYVKYGYLA